MALIAVTGGSGFVGRHLVPALLARGHQCRGLTREDLAAPAAALRGAADRATGDHLFLASRVERAA